MRESVPTPGTRPLASNAVPFYARKLADELRRLPPESQKERAARVDRAVECASTLIPNGLADTITDFVVCAQTAERAWLEANIEAPNARRCGSSASKANYTEPLVYPVPVVSQLDVVQFTTVLDFQQARIRDFNLMYSTTVSNTVDDVCLAHSLRFSESSLRQSSPCAAIRRAWSASSALRTVDKKICSRLL